MGGQARVKIDSDGTLSVIETISGGDTHMWAAMTNDGNHSSTGTDTWIDFYGGWRSNNSDGIFDFYDAGSGKNFLLCNQSGIYTFAWNLLTSDLAGTTPFDFEWQVRLNVLGGSSATTGGGTTNRFPSQTTSTPLVQWRDQIRIQTTAADDIILGNSVTLPIKHDSPGTSRRMGELKLAYSGGTGTHSWRARVWVIRHNSSSLWTPDDFSTRTVG